MKNVWILLIVLFTGCTSTLPHITEYRIEPQMQAVTLQTPSCQKSLKVGQVFSANSLLSQKMHYTQDGYKEAIYTESAWAQNPNKAISAQLVRSIRDAKLFGSVSSFKSRAHSQLYLETTVEKFMQHFSKDHKKSYVELVFSLNLIDTKSSKSLGTTLISKKLDVATMDANGGVMALNTALLDVLLETNVWLKGVCK